MGSRLRVQPGDPRRVHRPGQLTRVPMLRSSRSAPGRCLFQAFRIRTALCAVAPVESARKLVRRDLFIS